MDKKTLGIIMIVSIIAVAGVAYFGYQKSLFSGVGPGGGMIPGGGEENAGTETFQGGGQEGQKDPYGSAQEIKAPTGLASELKSIFSEACGGVKLETLNYNFPAQGADMLVYIWKNKPTEEKLRSALVKNGYEIEEGGFSDILFAKKRNLSLTIDWASPDREEGQEIVVLAAEEK